MSKAYNKIVPLMSKNGAMAQPTITSSLGFYLLTGTGSQAKLADEVLA